MEENESEKVALYVKQCETLNIFLQKHAISREQYEKSFRDLTAKMKMEKYFGTYYLPKNL